MVADFYLRPLPTRLLALMAEGSEDFAAFLDRLRTHAAPAMEECVRRYYALLYSVITKKVFEADEREDLVQEVFLKIISQRLFDRFKGHSEGELRSYLVRIALNHTFDHLKRYTRKDNENRAFLPEPDDLQKLLSSEDLFQGLVTREIHEELSRLIDTLPLRYKEIITLRLLDYSNVEIARMLHRPKGTIDSWTSRALAILRGKAGHLRNYLGEEKGANP